MLSEKNVLAKLINYLEAHGYPKETMAVEYKLGQFLVDLAIVDPKTNYPIQFFELKSDNSTRMLEMGKQQLRKFVSSIDNKKIPTYIVYPVDNEPGFGIERVYSDGEKLNAQFIAPTQTVVQTLDYEGQKNARYFERINDVNKEKDNTHDVIRKICWTSAPIILIIGILNNINIIKIENIDLIFLLLCFGIIILPYANKLKILGIEYERIKKEKEK